MPTSVDERIVSIDERIEHITFLLACALDARTRVGLEAGLKALERLRQRLVRSEELLQAA